VFDPDLPGDLGARFRSESALSAPGNWMNGSWTVFRWRRLGLVGLIYIIIGLVVAFQHNYITVHIIKLVLSAILAVLLWWLVLLGVNLHLA
jgi:hypothetical protein